MGFYDTDIYQSLIIQPQLWLEKVLTRALQLTLTPCEIKVSTILVWPFSTAVRSCLSFCDISRGGILCFTRYIGKLILNTFFFYSVLFLRYTWSNGFYQTSCKLVKISLSIASTVVVFDKIKKINIFLIEYVINVLPFDRFFYSLIAV